MTLRSGTAEETNTMRFIIGAIAGFAAGTAAAMITSGKSGAELRMEFERIRSDIQARDFEALGTQLDERLKELQSKIDEFMKQPGDTAAGAAAEAAEAADSVAEEIKDAAEAAEEAVTA